MKRALSSLAQAIRLKGRRLVRGAPPLAGYLEHRQEIAFVDPLSDADLTELNRLLRWNSFVVDRHGRRFGGVAWQGKRDRPEIIPDPRIVLLNERFALADKHVIEFGCFEGGHTIALSTFAGRVTAVDGRMENVVKTIVRTALFGYHPTVFKYDLEQLPAQVELLGADVLHHVGVLYHLADPVRHLLEIGRYIRLGLMLDTHHASEDAARSSYVVNGTRFRYQRYQELGHKDVFSGMRAHSKWITLDDIVGLLRQAGFPRVEVVQSRVERNGPRVLLFASRT